METNDITNLLEADKQALEDRLQKLQEQSVPKTDPRYFALQIEINVYDKIYTQIKQIYNK